MIAVTLSSDLGNLHGSATVKQILERRHVKRGIAAHLTTLQALFILYAEAFFKDNTDFLRACASKVDHLNQTCKNGNVEDMHKAHADMIDAYHCITGYCEPDGQI